MIRSHHNRTPLHTARTRHASHYVGVTKDNANYHELLDLEFQQIQQARRWLVEDRSRESAQLLHALIKSIAPYLKHRALYHDLLATCRDALEVSEESSATVGWLLLLRHEAQFALGNWDEAHLDVVAALEASESVDPPTHARALLALGHLQLNRGDYRSALKTLAEAEHMLLEAKDLDGVADAKAEVAAYYLNRNEWDKALRLYQEVDELRRRMDPSGPSDHTLLMLGVVHRGRGNHDRAVEYLSELRERGEYQRNPAAYATATHHLAWAKLTRGNIAEARRLGEEAKRRYQEFDDLRGMSDSDELLGMIALAEGDMAKAHSSLDRSFRVRVQIGNQHGAASSLRRLSVLQFHRGNPLKASEYLIRSLVLYFQLGVLGVRRLFHIARDMWHWRAIP